MKNDAYLDLFVRTTRLGDLDRALAPRASLLAGAAGVVIVVAALHRAGVVPARTVRAWLTKMRSLAEDRATAFVSRIPGEGPVPKAFLVGPASGPAGLAVATIEAAIALDDAVLLADGVHDFARAWQAASKSPHLTAELYGGSGAYAVHATRWVRTLEGAANVAAHVARLRAVADEARDHLHAILALPLARRTNLRLGAAHGLTGELYAALETAGTRSSPSHVEARLDDLVKTAVTDGDYVAWPAVVGGKVPDPMWGSFCNGVPGQLLLFATAAARTGDRGHRALAEKAANATFALRASRGSICCGLGGQVVALDAYARLTGEPRDRRRARTRLADATNAYGAGRALERFRVGPDNTPALLQGAGGIALLAARARRGAVLDPWGEGR